MSTKNEANILACGWLIMHFLWSIYKWKLFPTSENFYFIILSIFWSSYNIFFCVIWCKKPCTWQSLWNFKHILWCIRPEYLKPAEKFGSNPKSKWEEIQPHRAKLCSSMISTWEDNFEHSGLTMALCNGGKSLLFKRKFLTPWQSLAWDWWTASRKWWHLKTLLISSIISKMVLMALKVQQQSKYDAFLVMIRESFCSCWGNKCISICR